MSRFRADALPYSLALLLLCIGLLTLLASVFTLGSQENILNQHQTAGFFPDLPCGCASSAFSALRSQGHCRHHQLALSSVAPAQQLGWPEGLSVAGHRGKFLLCPGGLRLVYVV